MLHRREFLKHASVLPLASRWRATPVPASERVLVVVELNGGNDGVNTVVPFRDEGYAQHRKALRLPREELLTFDDDLGLHPALDGFAKLWERGELAVVQGVSYPRPNLSHDVSLAIWHTGRLDRAGRKGAGWIGRAVDARHGARRGAPGALLAGDHALPGALRTRRGPVATVPSLELYLEAAELGSGVLARSPDATIVSDHVRRILADARDTAHSLKRSLGEAASAVSYPRSPLATELQLIAQLIRSGLETPIYYAVQPGYDTHFLQAEPHAARLGELGGAVSAFLDDVRAAGQAERVLVLVFSEFGRRVPENASRGTDHGTAGPVFVAGAGVVPGVHGTTPSLTELDDGNLGWTIDFRSVYAALLERWLGCDALALLGAPFEPVPVVGT